MRIFAIIYAIVGLIVNTISVFSVKELPDADKEMEKERKEEHTLTFFDSFKLLLKKKYYVIICITSVSYTHLDVYKRQFYLRDAAEEEVDLMQGFLHICRRYGQATIQMRLRILKFNIPHQWVILYLQYQRMLQLYQIIRMAELHHLK